MIPVPRCAVCCRPVDKVTVSRNEISCRDTWTVYCHGERESVTIDEEMVMSCSDMRMGQAFTGRKALTSG